MLDIVHLNVRGYRVETLLQTLTKFPESLLARYIGTQLEHNYQAEVFIDRSPDIFCQFLDCLSGVRKIQLTPRLEEEAQHWECPLEESNYQQRHYLLVKLGIVPSLSPILNCQNQNIRQLVGPKCENVDYNLILLQYANKFQYQMTNYWFDQFSNQIIVEMSPY